MHSTQYFDVTPLAVDAGSRLSSTSWPLPVNSHPKAHNIFPFNFNQLQNQLERIVSQESALGFPSLSREPRFSCCQNPPIKYFYAPRSSQDEKMGCVQFSTIRGPQHQGDGTEMNQDKAVLTLVLLLAPFFLPSIAAAQSAKPTAAQDIQLTVFGAASGDYTGLAGGRNLSFTAGIDLALAPWHGMRPTLELRGTYPIDKGTIVAQKDVLGGLRLDFLLGRRVHPYGDFLFGRGEMNYVSGGYTYPVNPAPGIQPFTYLLSTTYVYSPGAGFDFDLTNHLAIKVDGQYQQWGSVPTASGTLHSTLGTIGLVYRFGKRGMP
jgi:hypothetical protein